MASEISIGALSVSFSKSGVSASFSKGAFTINVAGTKCTRMTQAIGTTAEALDLGDIGTAGWLLIVNLDATNFVKIRNGSGGADVVKIKAGEAALFRLATDTPFLIADTAAVTVDYLLIED